MSWLAPPIFRQPHCTYTTTNCHKLFVFVFSSAPSTTKNSPYHGIGGWWWFPVYPMHPPHQSNHFACGKDSAVLTLLLCVTCCVCAETSWCFDS